MGIVNEAKGRQRGEAEGESIRGGLAVDLAGATGVEMMGICPDRLNSLLCFH